MMDNQLNEKLSQLGLNDKEATLYLTLLYKGIQTPLQLSRNCSLKRPTIYRLIEDLKKKGFIAELVKDNSHSYKSCSPQDLNLILAKKEADLNNLKQIIPQLITDLSDIIETPHKSTKVLYYHGITGLQQMLWNTLSTKDKEILGFGYLSWNEAVGKTYAEKIRQEYVKRNIIGKEILNNSDYDKKYTSVIEYIKSNYRQKVLPEKILKIKHDTYIYDNVFGFYHILKKDIFGVEIVNQEIADTQKQLFEILWKMAKSPHSTKKI